MDQIEYTARELGQLVVDGIAMGLGLSMYFDDPTDDSSDDSSDDSGECEDDDDRCRKVKDTCIRGCSDFVLNKPKKRRNDLGGMDFHRCVRQCMDRNGC